MCSRQTRNEPLAAAEMVGYRSAGTCKGFHEMLPSDEAWPSGIPSGSFSPYTTARRPRSGPRLVEDEGVQQWMSAHKGTASRGECSGDIYLRTPAPRSGCQHLLQMPAPQPNSSWAARPVGEEGSGSVALTGLNGGHS